MHLNLSIPPKFTSFQQLNKAEPYLYQMDKSKKLDRKEL